MSTFMYKTTLDGRKTERGTHEAPSMREAVKALAQVYRERPYRQIEILDDDLQKTHTLVSARAVRLVGERLAYKF